MKCDNAKALYVLLAFLCNVHLIQTSAQSRSNQTLSEILCNVEEGSHIFTCKVFSNYKTSNGIYHEAVVTQKFRGLMADTIRLTIGENRFCYVGYDHTERRLGNGSEHLIIAKLGKNDVYHSIYGSTGHSGILNLKYNQSYEYLEERSKQYLDIVQRYFDKERSEYTGPFHISVEEHFQASGQMVNGLADGEWHHIDSTRNLHKKINYSRGNWHGLHKRYWSYEDEIKNLETSEYEMNSLLSKESTRIDLHGTKSVSKLEYKEGALVRSSKYATTEKDSIILGSSRIREADLLGMNSVLHGPYLELPSNKRHHRYGEEYARGTYHYGAKIGEWTYYSGYGDVDSVVVYPEPVASEFSFVFYHENGQPAVVGNKVNGIKEGSWYEYDISGMLLNTLSYDNGLPSGTYWRSPTFSIEYVKGQRTGWSVSYNEEGKISSRTHYRNDIKDGLEEECDRSGRLLRSARYEKGIKVGFEYMYDASGKIFSYTYYDGRGAKKGYHQRYNRKGSLINAGTYVDGYKAGEWKFFQPGGTDRSTSYPEDPSAVRYTEKNLFKGQVEAYDPAIHSVIRK